MLEEILTSAFSFVFVSACLYALLAFISWSFILSPPLWFAYVSSVSVLLLYAVVDTVTEITKKGK